MKKNRIKKKDKKEQKQKKTFFPVGNNFKQSIHRLQVTEQK